MSRSGFPVLGAVCIAVALAGWATPLAARPPTAPRDSAQDTSRDGDAFFSESGGASWYGQRHEGRDTAQGVPFDPTEFTAAHRTLKFGTIVQVTNLANHRKVKVQITDRGPHVAGRVIDVSEAAARELGMQRRGTARVSIRAFDYDQFPD